ncbi:hypothetical protein [Pantoea sp. Ap-967]|uniref:hypothetical protein n=1 Tax=Pantoea sp. Ap-967 TaxID=2608362 RepID=UPI00196257B3|nr:hypothetical protein [Pantoea sp. Ap-967]
MRIRGKKYREWAGVPISSNTHEEVFSDGILLEVQARLSRTGATQLFIGIYASSGKAIREETYGSRPGETIMRALAWGVERARRIASDRSKYPTPGANSSTQSVPEMKTADPPSLPDTA